MIISTESIAESLGTEPLEVFGFSTQEELDVALFPLMQDVIEVSND